MSEACTYKYQPFKHIEKSERRHQPWWDHAYNAHWKSWWHRRYDKQSADLSNLLIGFADIKISWHSHTRLTHTDGRPRCTGIIGGSCVSRCCDRLQCRLSSCDGHFELNTGHNAAIHLHRIPHFTWQTSLQNKHLLTFRIRCKFLLNLTGSCQNRVMVNVTGSWTNSMTQGYWTRLGVVKTGLG